MVFIELKELEEKMIVPGYRARFVHSERMSVAYWSIEAGAILPQHSHPHEQITNVVEGRFELTVDGEMRVLEMGVAAVIPPDAPHSGVAVTDCRLVDTFCPVREDYR